MSMMLFRRACSGALVALLCMPVVHLPFAQATLFAQSVSARLTNGPTVAWTLPVLRTGDAFVVGRSQPITIVAVFASWCRSCKDEVAVFNDLQRRYKASGARVVAVSADEGSSERLMRWLDNYKAQYPVVRDSTGAVMRAMGVVGVPEVHVLDTHGQIVWSRRGPVDSKVAELNAVMLRLQQKQQVHE